MEIIIREAMDSDIDSLGGRLRDADFKEIIAGGNQDGYDALRQSFTLSKLCYTVDIDGNPVAMFGVVSVGPILAPVGRVWFLGADELSKIKKSFVKLSRQIIANFLLQFPVLFNFVDSHYVSSISWLRSCGAVFDDKPLNIEGVDFYGFVIRRA